MAQEMIANFPPWLIAVFAVAQVWDLCWRGMGMWKASKKNKLPWFVAMLLFNTIGILPIIYLAWFDKHSIAEPVKKKK